MGTNILLSISKQQILEWIDTGCLVAFIVVLALILILALRGLLRGWKSGTYRVIFLALFFIIPLLCLGPISGAVGGIDLHQWIAGPIVIEFNQGTQVSVPVTTVYETLYNLVYALLHDGLKLNASPAAIANYSIALAGSLIRLALVFVWAIITLTIGSLLITLLWHIGFKFFIPKPKRKPTKRWISSIEEALAFLAIAIVGISPLTGLVSAIKNNAVIPPSQNETVNLVRDVINTYDNSIFNKAFFAWTKGAGTDTLDTQIAQFIAQNSYTVDGKTYQANLVKEVRIFSNVEGALSSVLFTEKPTDALASSILHSSLLVGQSLYLLAQGDGELFETLTPLAYEIAENVDFLQEEFQGSGLSADFEFSKKARMQTFGRIASSEFVHTIESAEAETFVPVYDGLGSFSSATLDRIEERMAEDADARAYVNAVLSGFVYQDYLNNGDSIFADLLPMNAKGELNEKRFAKIDWFKEAQILRTSKEAMEALPKNAIADTSMNSEDEMVADFLANAAKNMPALIKALIGERDASGEPLTNDAGESQSGICLLDSDLISYVLPAALQFGALTVNQEVLTDPEDPADFLDQTAAIADRLIGNPDKPSEEKINYKRELGHILDIAGDFTQSEAGQAFLADYKNHPGLEFASDGTLIEFNPAIADAFMTAIENLDSSQLMTYMSPVLGNHYIRPLLAADGALGKMGIEKVDFNCPNLGKELSNIISVAKYCPDVLASIGAITKTDQTGTVDANSFFHALTAFETAEKHYEVTHLLDILTGSPILNPVYTIDSKEVTNYNIANLLQYFLKDIDPDSRIEITYETLDGVALVSDWDGDNLRTRRDNYFTVQVFRQLAETGIVEELSQLAESSSTEAINTLSKVGIDELFANIGRSTTLRKILPPFFDANLLGTLLDSDKILDLEAIGVTYKNLITPEDWANEGIAMQAILNLAANGLDLSSLDVFDPSVIELVRELAKSNIFVMPDGTYVFDDFFTDKIMLSINEYSQFKLFTDYAEKKVDAFGGKTVKQVLEEKGEAYWTSKSAQVVADKKALSTTFVRAMALPETKEGWDAELVKLGKVVASLNSLGGIDSLTEFKAESVPALVMALNDICSMDSLGAVLPPNVFYKAFESGSVSSSLKTENANIGWFFRNAEQLVTAMEENGTDRSGAAVSAVISQRDRETDFMVSLIKLAANNQALKDGNFNFETLDSDTLLRPLFYASRNSKVFNPSSVNDLYSPTEKLPELTVFEDLILTFVKNSGVYIFVDKYTGAESTTLDDDQLDRAYLKGTQKTLKSVIKSITASKGWDKETEVLCALVDVLKGSAFLKDGQISFEEFSTKEGLRSFFSKADSKEELFDLIAALQQSELFYRCLPAKLEKAINDALVGMTFGYLDKDISCADFYLYEDPSDKVDFPRYTYEGEGNTVEGLVNVFASLAFCTDVDMTDFSTVEVGPLMAALREMAVSPIFNSDTTKSMDAFAGVAPERQGMTAFQALFADVLNVDSLTAHYYFATSPKDIANAANYTDAITKNAYVIRNAFPSLNGSNRAIIAEHADRYIVTELGDLLRVCKEDRFKDFLGKGSDSGDFGKLDEDAFASLLHALNDCTILRDCVPNGAQETLVDGDVINVDGISLKSADVYFSYYYYDADGNFSTVRQVTPNFDMPFYSPEIDQLAMIYSSLKDNKEILSEMKMKDLDPSLVRGILLDLHDSYVFHEARKDARLDEGDPATVAYEYFEDLTVFEQFIYKVMLKADLHNMNYSSAHFYQYTFAEDWDYILNNPGNYVPTRTGTIGAYYKAHSDILNITKGGDNWLDEINAFTTDGLHHDGILANDPIIGIVAAGQDAGLFSETSSTVSIDFKTIESIAPDKIRGLMYAVAKSNLLDDALGISMGSLLGVSPSSNAGIGLHEYSEHTYKAVLGSTALDATHLNLQNAASLFDDGDNAKTYHPVAKINVPTDGNVTGSFTAVYRLNAGTTLDITDMITCNYEAGVTTFNGPGFGEIAMPLEITLTGGHNFLGDADLVVDFANYYLTPEEYRGNPASGEKGAIDAIGYLLSSAYRGDGSANRYFSFNNDVPDGKNALSMFFEEYESGTSAYDHSTYGLLALFSDSGFYEAKLDENDAFVTSGANHTVAASALYNALKFEVSAPIDVHVYVEAVHRTFDLPSNTELSLGDLIGKGTTSAQHLHKLEAYLNVMTLEHMDQVTKEAFWFDNFATSAGTYDAYNTTLSTIFTDVEYSLPVVQYYVTAGVDQAFAESDSPSAIEEIRKALSSTVYDASASIVIPLSDTNTENYNLAGISSNLGRSVVANLIGHSGALKSETVAIDFASPTVLFGDSNKSTRTALTAFPDDLFGPSEDFAPMTAEYLSKVDACFALMKTLYGAADFTAMNQGFLTLAGGSDNAFADLFYLASLYDVMRADTKANHVFYYDDATHCADLHSFLVQGNVNGVLTDLTFQNVAALYA